MACSFSSLTFAAICYDFSCLSKRFARRLALAHLQAQAAKRSVDSPGDERRGKLTQLIERGVELCLSRRQITTRDSHLGEQFVRNGDVLGRLVVAGTLKQPPSILFSLLRIPLREPVLCLP